MAGKARRAASRQGQLKRKKQTKGPSGIPAPGRVASVPEADDVADMPENAFESTMEQEALSTSDEAIAPPVPRAASSRTPRGELGTRGQGRLRGERPAAYLYVGAEFRRILCLTSAVLAALIVLGIVL